MSNVLFQSSLMGFHMDLPNIHSPCILQSFADDVSSIRGISPISEWPLTTHSLKPSSYATSPMISFQIHSPLDSQTHLCGPPLKDLSPYLLYVR